MKTNHHQQNRKAQQARRAARKARTAQLHSVSTVATEPVYYMELSSQVPQYGKQRKLMGRYRWTFHPDNLSARAAMKYLKLPHFLMSLLLGGRLYE